MSVREAEDIPSEAEPSPSVQSSIAPDTLSQAESLLRSASLLLAKEAHLPAVHVLHREILRELGHAQEARSLQPYRRRAEADGCHRKLLDRLGAARASVRYASYLTELRLRLPEWVSWAVLVLLVAGLTLRYAWALASRSNWARQHPEGNWLSRYYSTPSFQGYPLVRYDVGVNYDWSSGAPAQAMARDHWSARWDTCVSVSSEVSLHLRLSADDSAQLVLNDVTMIDVPKPGHAEATITLHPGTRHLRVDFQEKQGMARIRL